MVKDIQVVNIVVSSSLEHDIPLEKMAATLSNTEYNPEQFPGLVIRIKEQKNYKKKLKKLDTKSKINQKLKFKTS